MSQMCIIAEIHQICVHGLGPSINQNLKCNIDRYKRAWPITYLIIIQDAFEKSLLDLLETSSSISYAH